MKVAFPYSWKWPLQKSKTTFEWMLFAEQMCVPQLRSSWLSRGNCPVSDVTFLVKGVRFQEERNEVDWCAVEKAPVVNQVKVTKVTIGTTLETASCQHCTETVISSLATSRQLLLVDFLAIFDGRGWWVGGLKVLHMKKTSPSSVLFFLFDKKMTPIFWK